MTDWQAVWDRLSNGEHVVLCGTGAMPEPSPTQIRLSWVDCEAHPDPGATIEAARRCIDRDLGINPWLDAARQRLRWGLRRHLLGEGDEDIDAACDARAFQRTAPNAVPPRRVLFLSGVDKADRSSLERLTRLFSSGHEPRWPLLIRFDAREPAGASRALFEQLQRVLPKQAFFFKAPGGAPRGGTEGSPDDAIASLSAESRRVLRAAATIGDRFEVETVALLLEIDDLAVLDALQEALECGLSLKDRGHGIFRLEPSAGALLRATTMPALANAWHRRLAELFGGPPAPLAENGGRRRAQPLGASSSSEPSVAEEAADPARSARHSDAAGLPENAAASYLAAALAAAQEGYHVRALAAAERALALAGSVSVPQRHELEARALLVVGECRWLGRAPGVTSLDQALDALERAREHAAITDHPELHAAIATMVANVCYDIGTPEALERALVEITRANQLWLGAGRPLDAARLLNDEAAIWIKRGNPVRAMQLLGRSREAFAALAATQAAARLELLETEHLLARAMLHSAGVLGHDAWRVGVEHALSAEAGYTALNEQRQLGRVWETLGRLQLHVGRLDEAGDWLARARRLQCDMGDAIGAARSAGGMSEVFVAKQDYTHALSSLEDSVAFNTEKGSAAGLQHNLATLRQLEAQLPNALVDQARALGQRIARALSTS